MFTDCLILLLILAKWGQEDFWPDPDEIKHFDIIEPCLQLLRGRQAVTRLVKVKSHSGLLMNERADALAELGRASDMAPSWQGPRKYDRPPWAQCQTQHPRNLRTLSRPQRS